MQLLRTLGIANIRVEHFVSDDTSIYTGSAESKYKEAIAKIALEKLTSKPAISREAAR
jgi:hypothetical protein